MKKASAKFWEDIFVFSVFHVDLCIHHKSEIFSNLKSTLLYQNVILLL